jgi:hypothetical protein
VTRFLEQYSRIAETNRVDNVFAKSRRFVGDGLLIDTSSDERQKASSYRKKDDSRPTTGRHVFNSENGLEMASQVPWRKALRTSSLPVTNSRPLRTITTDIKNLLIKKKEDYARS